MNTSTKPLDASPECSSVSKRRLTFDDLFPANPALRWNRALEYARQSGKELRDEIRSRFKDWPLEWFGAANAWMVFLGPSPGDSSGRQRTWDTEKWPVIGEAHDTWLNYVESRPSFWPPLRKWTEAAYKIAGVFTDTNACFGVTLLANVLSTPQGKARRIADEDLVEAMPRVVDQLELVRPRLIFTIDRRLGPLLVDELKSRGGTMVGRPASVEVPAKGHTLRPRSWHMQGSHGSVLISESPQHPSKINLTIPEKIEKYLAMKVKQCLK